MPRYSNQINTDINTRFYANINIILYYFIIHNINLLLVNYYIYI